MQARAAQPGHVTWIGLRPARRTDLRVVDAVEIGLDGLRGDHGRPGKRAVTLFQSEHLDAIASYLGRESIDPLDLRRNIHVAGVNLSAMRGRVLRLGTAQVEITVPCAPCSRMEETFGHGGYAALRQHGGWCAEVVQPGKVCLGDTVLPLAD